MPDWLAILKGFVDTLETNVGSAVGHTLTNIVAKIGDSAETLIFKLTKPQYELTLWSIYQAQVSLTGVAGNKALPSITILDLPADAVVVRAIMLFKFGNKDNVHATLVNSLDGAQNIQAQKAVAGAWITAITLAGGEFSTPAITREGGDVMMGDADITAQIPANGAVIDFRWTAGWAAENNLNFNDVQIGLKLYYRSY